ncbi:helix-turn-helix domain-containing protein [Leifsonia poae]|uniref:AraC family transcriptional regulator n=1 Tax=Leifsonia poae TaxID=110933 RepID=UPI003D68C998
MQYSLTWAADRPEDAAERLSATLRKVAIETDDRGRFGVRADERGDEAVALVRTAWRGSGRARTEADDLLIVGDVYAGSLAVQAGGRRLDVSGLVLLPLGGLEASWDGAHGARVVRFARSAIDAYALDVIGPHAAPVSFSEARPVDQRHEQLWRTIERHARTDVAADPKLLHNDLIWDATARHLIAAMLTAFPNSTLGATGSDRSDRALPSTIRRAVAYMEEHLSEPVRIADIAAAARLSPRGLQDAFRRLLGRTPTHHFRLLRLEAARDELLRSDPAEGATVAGIARRWGFEHVPRFAASYREQFGENPRDTLRR